jgi:hypothetical protein
MKYRLIALGLIALVLSACSVFKEPQFNKVNEIALKDLTADHTSLDLSLPTRIGMPSQSSHSRLKFRTKTAKNWVTS